MNKIMIHVWGVYLRILFQCARIVFTITRMRVCGALTAIWHKEKILLIQKSYRDGWFIPGGMLKKGETWQQAAVRETFEEVGIRLKEKDLVFVKAVSGDLGPHDQARLFEVRIEGTPTIKIDQREIINAKFVTLEEALQCNLIQEVKMYLRARTDHPADQSPHHF